MNTELLKNIGSKKQKLEDLRSHLKNKFFGIDNEIDKIVDSMKTWYVMPDIITHPIIINLWSLTGNGKTDLVRTIVEFLHFNDSFCEIQLSDTATDGATKISELILKSGCKENIPGIVLLDEFQRYRTKDQLGGDVKGMPYQDIWLLLSDGKFPYQVESKKSKLTYVRGELAYEWCSVIRTGQLPDVVEYDDYTIDDEEVQLQRNGKTRKMHEQVERKDDKNFSKEQEYLVNSIVELLDYSITPEQVFASSYLKMWSHIKEYFTNRASTYNFTKCLIFIAGNLDEAFQVANDIDNCDTDADIFHEYTKRVSIINIKQALSTRFKPEQISRLGNNHVIYPSLNKNAYKNIIKRTCLEYLKNVEKVSGINFTLHDSVLDEIYENAVYPTQGTRPVFSSIHMMFGSPLSSGVLWAIENDFKDITIRVYFDALCISFIHEETQNETCVPIQFQVRDRKNRHGKNFSTMVAVHEMGHAILHAELFKQAPREIRIAVAAFDGGYNRYDFQHSCAKDVLDRICVGYGGIIAEEIVFGKEYRSTGAASDIDNIGNLASSYVRQWNMGGRVGFVGKAIVGVTASDNDVELILREQKDRALVLMTKYKDFLIQSSIDLLDRKAFTKEQFVEYCGNTFTFENDNRDNTKIDTNAQYYDLLMSHKK